MTNQAERPRLSGRAARHGRVLEAPITGQEIVLIVVIAVLWVALAGATPSFLTPGSIQPLVNAVAPVAVIGIGMTFVVITGGIDVSVGGAVMLCAVVTARLLVHADIPLIAAVVLSVMLGILLGFINGLLIAHGRVAAIVITFGTANLFQFVALRVFNSSVVNGIPETLSFFGRGESGRTLGIPNSFAITVVLAVAAALYLRHTVGGRNLFAIGGNPTAARLAGIKVVRRTVFAYGVTGAFAGLGALFLIASGTSTLDQSIGSGQELKVIAAVVIGGTSILGGRGSILGTVLGAVLVQTVTSGVTQLGWPSELGALFTGIAILVAVGADLVRQRRKAARG